MKTAFAYLQLILECGISSVCLIAMKVMIDAEYQNILACRNDSEKFVKTKDVKPCRLADVRQRIIS